jgi:hypothetical protein
MGSSLPDRSNSGEPEVLNLRNAETSGGDGVDSLQMP